MVERTDDHPGTGSATYCSAVSLRQASRTLVLDQRSYANNATTSSCMRISPGLGHPHTPAHIRSPYNLLFGKTPRPRAAAPTFTKIEFPIIISPPPAAPAPD